MDIVSSFKESPYLGKIYVKTAKPRRSGHEIQG